MSEKTVNYNIEDTFTLSDIVGLQDDARYRQNPTAAYVLVKHYMSNRHRSDNLAKEFACIAYARIDEDFENNKDLEEDDPETADYYQVIRSELDDFAKLIAYGISPFCKVKVPDQ